MALILRISVMAVLLAHNKLGWGANELGGIARALVEGHGFSSAFHDARGPTAWFAPAYPALLAGVFRVFGVETRASAIVAILLNVVFASLTAAILVRLGREQLHETAGIIAAWTWAISPPLLFMPWLLWETCLSGMVFAFSFMMTLRLTEASSLRDWGQCGAIWGLAGLVNPATLAPLPALAIYAAVRNRRWQGFVITTLMCALCILPWTARNFFALGRLVPVRSNFWPELYFANAADFDLHPLGNSMLYQREGEALFVADMKARAVDVVRSNPGVFCRQTRKRIVAFWAQPAQLSPFPVSLFLMSLGGIFIAWQRSRPWFAYLSVFVLYPLVYYATYDFARFRYPIEPLMYGLAAYFLCELLAGLRKVPGLRQEDGKPPLET